ncbi:MAG: glycosyltransferase family 4 protein, partial [Caldilineaceae bacterium]
MHILFVIAEYPPAVGGVGAYTAELARALVAEGATVSVLTAARGGSLAPAVRTQGVFVYPAIDRWGPAIWRRVAQVAHDLGADWLHVQYQTAAFGMNPAINFAPERWRKETSVAWTYHDLLPPYLFPKAGARIRSLVTLRPAHHSHLVIATNEGDRQQLAAAGVDAQAIPIGSNVPGLTLSHNERDLIRQRYGYTQDHVVLGFFGFLNRSKGAPTLLRALRCLLDDGVHARLLLIGEGLGASDPTNRETLAEIQALITTLGLGERVTSTGELDDTGVAAALNAVDFLLLPYADGASLRRGTMMAGLANGCAIVTTPPQGAMPELQVGRDLLIA